MTVSHIGSSRDNKSLLNLLSKIFNSSSLLLNTVELVLPKPNKHNMYSCLQQAFHCLFEKTKNAQGTLNFLKDVVALTLAGRLFHKRAPLNEKLRFRTRQRKFVSFVFEFLISAEGYEEVL